MSSSQCKLGIAITLSRGFDLPEQQRLPGVVPVITSSGVTGYHNVAKMKGPGVVTGRYGTLGAVYYVEEDYWPHNTALYVKDFKGNNPRFVSYLLRGASLALFNGAGAVPGVNRNVLHEIDIRLPDSDEQRRIADILSAYDDLIENNRRRMALLEEAARMIYQEWFVRLRFPGYESARIVDGVPEGWERKQMQDVCDSIGGGTPSTSKQEYWDGGTITWVTPTDITKNECLVLLDSEKKITERGLRNSSAKMLPADTILMTSRASVGFFGVIDREVCTNQGFISVIPHEQYYRMYLLYNLISRREEIILRANGATYREINKSTFREMPVVLPSKGVLLEFSSQAYTLLQQVRLLKKQNLKLQQARDILLPKLMSGEIDVSETPSTAEKELVAVQ